MRIAAIEPPDVPPSAQGYSPAILAEGRKILFVSGQCGDDLNADLETVLEQEARALSILMFSADHKEAISALQEKRAPVFKGR